MMDIQPWYNETWIVALATTFGGVATVLGVLVLLRQLKALNRKNEFDVLQIVGERMDRRFGRLAGAETSGDQIATPDSPLYALRSRFREDAQHSAIPTDRLGQQDNHISSLPHRIAVVRDLQEPARREDFAIVRQYVNRMNDVSEMIEERLIDVRSFLGKYHLAIIREIYLAEPYIYYQNLYGQAGRWGIRVLCLGAAARQFNDVNPIHRAAVFFADDPEFGCVYRAPTGRILWLRNHWWSMLYRFGWTPTITRSSMSRQRRLLEAIGTKVPPVDSPPTGSNS